MANVILDLKKKKKKILVVQILLISIFNQVIQKIKYQKYIAI